MDTPGDDVKTLCVSIDEAKNEFIQLRDDELILPEDMEFRECLSSLMK